MQTGDDRSILISTMPATSRDRTAALAVVGVSSVLFLCAVPFASLPLTPVPAFVASYQSALAINDLITAVLLFSQFAVLRSRALLLLASGYLFIAADFRFSHSDMRCSGMPMAAPKYVLRPAGPSSEASLQWPLRFRR